MRTENKSSLKKLIPLLLVAIAFIFIIVIFYTFSQENSIKKNTNYDFFSVKTEIEAVPQEKSTPFILFPENLELPECEGGNDHEKVKHLAYSICYRESFEQAEYSAYVLTSDELVKNSSRTENFRSDPAVSTGSAHKNDYRGSGFDRGHLSPAGDFTYSEEAMSESFFMSNMSPQAPGLNRGIWKDLESAVRNWAKSFGRVYVISGPILEKKPGEYEKIGLYSIVAVPEYFYKVVLIPLYADDEDKASPEDAANVLAMGFVFPNEKCEGTIWDWQTSIDDIEKRTGLNFFAKLDDELENKIESEIRRPE